MPDLPGRGASRVGKPPESVTVSVLMQVGSFLFSVTPLVPRAIGGLFGAVADRKEFSRGRQEGDLVYPSSLGNGGSSVGEEECPHFPHVLPFLLNWSD